MNKGRTIRSLAIGVATLVAAGGAILVASTPSQAVPTGTLSFTPHTGMDVSSITVNTSGPCTDPGASNLQVSVSGPGFPAVGQNVVGNSPLSAYSQDANGGFIVPLSDTMRDFANLQTPPATLSGQYVFTLTCRKAISQSSLGDFTGSLWFNNNSTFVDQNPATTTTVGIAPSSPLAGRAMTFTANVASGAGTPAGVVTFKDGAATLGTATLAGGVATLSGTLSGGSHTITASYPGGGIFGASSGSATTLVKLETTLKANSIVTSLVPGLKLYSAKLTGTITGGPVAGQTVSFYSGATFLCSGVTDGTGLAGCPVTALVKSPTAILGSYTATFTGNGYILPAAPSSAALA